MLFNTTIAADAARNAAETTNNGAERFGFASAVVAAERAAGTPVAPSAAEHERADAERALWNAEEDVREARQALAAARSTLDAATRTARAFAEETITARVATLKRNRRGGGARISIRGTVDGSPYGVAARDAWLGLDAVYCHEARAWSLNHPTLGAVAEDLDGRCSLDAFAERAARAAHYIADDIRAAASASQWVEAGDADRAEARLAKARAARAALDA